MKRPERDRDGQQWINDYLLKATGRAVHYELDARVLPPQAKSMAMVSKYVTKEAEHAERLAKAAEAHGDPLNARAYYRMATEHYREAQHFVVPPPSPKRWDLYAKTKECAAKLFELADYPIEAVELESDGKSYPGVFHRLDGDQPAPAVIFIPGMDMTKENYPNPLDNEFRHYGMHVLAIDGPGQGEALERGHFVTPTNHIDVAKAAFEYLAARPEVDETRIGIAGRSFGTFWSLRAAADEPRLAAVGGAVGCYFWDRLTIFDEAPIRFKQVFMAMSGMTDEAEFDKISEGYTLKGHSDRVECPVFMGIGEFDPLNPMEDAEAVFDSLSGAKEMWIFEDQFHSVATNKCLMGRNTYNFIAEWMRRALDGKISSSHQKKTFIKNNGEGLYAE